MYSLLWSFFISYYRDFEVCLEVCIGFGGWGDVIVRLRGYWCGLEGLVD